MSDYLENIDNLPDISFIDNKTLEDVQVLLINSFQEKYKTITGKKITLSRADPNRLILLSCAQVIYQGLQNIDKAGKMNFLKYAYGDYLKNLAALKNVTENEPKKATVPVCFRLAGAREAATSIPAGSRVTAAYDVYFETTEYNEIPAGKVETTVMMTCTQTGEIGNGFMAGELTILVDPIGVIESVSNTETSSGGTGKESDQSIAERVFLAPSSYSTAGPDDAYIYWAKNYDQRVGDVLPTSPAPGVVDIRFILNNGSIPDAAMIAGMTEYLRQRSKRPLTDNVIIAAPDIVEYNIDLTYYINTSDSSSAVQIKEQAEAALEDYKLWQSSKIGRDINPDELRKFLKNAGVKRMEVTEPRFVVLDDIEVAVLKNINVRYGGLEND